MSSVVPKTLQTNDGRATASSRALHQDRSAALRAPWTELSPRVRGSRTSRPVRQRGLTGCLKAPRHEYSTMAYGGMLFAAVLMKNYHGGSSAVHRGYEHHLSPRFCRAREGCRGEYKRPSGPSPSGVWCRAVWTCVVGGGRAGPRWSEGRGAADHADACVRAQQNLS